MVGDFGERGERADGQAVGRGVDAAQLRDVADVDQARGRIGAVLHAVEQIDAAGFDHGAVLELRERCFDGGAICEGEGVHRASDNGWGWLRAARTTAGVMGNWRMRTPVAL